MKERIKTRVNRFWDRIRPLLILLVGCFLVYGIIQILNYSATNIDSSPETAPLWQALNTAVRIVGIFFILIWGFFTLDHTFAKTNLKQSYGLPSKTTPRVSRFFTHPFVHGNEGHVRGNLPHLLLFVGIATLMVPSAQAFLLITVIMLIVEGIGVWVYGSKGNHIGASGLVLGYYSFIVGYGWLMWSLWLTATAIIIAIVFIKPTYEALRNREDQISVAGHWFGFLGGFIAAAVLVQLT